MWYKDMFIYYYQSNHAFNVFSKKNGVLLKLLYVVSFF